MSATVAPTSSTVAPSQASVTTFSQVESSQDYGQFHAGNASVEIDSDGSYYLAQGFEIRKLREGEQYAEWSEFFDGDDISLGKDGYVYMAEDGGTARKFDTESGAPAYWDTGSLPGSGPYRAVADDNGGVYLLSSRDFTDEVVFARFNPDDPDSEDGGTLWGVEGLGVADDAVSPPIRTNDSQDVTLIFDDEIRLYDGKNGSQIDSASLPDGTTAARFLTSDDSETIYFFLSASHGDSILGAFTWGGGIQWDIETTVRANGLDIDDDGVIHVSSYDTGDVHEYDASDGTYIGLGGEGTRPDVIGFGTFPDYPHQSDAWETDKLDVVGAAPTPPTSTMLTLQPEGGAGRGVGASQATVSATTVNPVSASSASSVAEKAVTRAFTAIPRTSILAGLDPTQTASSSTNPTASSQITASVETEAVSIVSQDALAFRKAIAGATPHASSPSIVDTSSTSQSTASVDTDIGVSVTSPLPTSSGMASVQSTPALAAGVPLSTTGSAKAHAVSSRTPFGLASYESSAIIGTSIDAKPHAQTPSMTTTTSTSQSVLPVEDGATTTVTMQTARSSGTADARAVSTMASGEPLGPTGSALTQVSSNRTAPGISTQGAFASRGNSVGAIPTTVAHEIPEVSALTGAKSVIVDRATAEALTRHSNATAFVSPSGIGVSVTPQPTQIIVNEQAVVVVTPHTVNGSPNGVDAKTESTVTVYPTAAGTPSPVTDGSSHVVSTGDPVGVYGSPVVLEAAGIGAPVAFTQTVRTGPQTTESFTRASTVGDPVSVGGAPFSVMPTSTGAASVQPESIDIESPMTSATSQSKVAPVTADSYVAPTNVDVETGIGVVSNVALVTLSLSTITNIQPRFETLRTGSNDTTLVPSQNELDVTTHQGDR